MHQEGTTVETISQQAAKLRSEWDTNPRWNDTERTYSAQDVVRILILQGAAFAWQLQRNEFGSGAC